MFETNLRCRRIDGTADAGAGRSASAELFPGRAALNGAPAGSHWKQRTRERNHTRKLRLLTAALTVAAAAAVVPRQALAFGGPFMIQDAATGNCLAVAGGPANAHGDGGRVIAWPCTGTLDQYWGTYPSPSGDGVLLVNWGISSGIYDPSGDGLDGNECLSVDGGNAYQGAPLIIWHCKPAGQDADQSWILNPGWSNELPSGEYGLWNVAGESQGLFASNWQGGCFSGSAAQGDPITLCPDPMGSFEPWIFTPNFGLQF